MRLVGMVIELRRAPQVVAARVDLEKAQAAVRKFGFSVEEAAGAMQRLGQLLRALKGEKGGISHHA